MIVRYLASFLILSALALASCNTTKYSLSNPPSNTISFGDGGGFAGIETGFTLLENGQVFKHNSTGDTTELESLKKKEAQNFYEKFKGLRLSQLDIEQPGNLYYFIKYTTSDIDHGVTWGAADYNVRTDILDFYKSLRKMTKDRKTIEKPSKVDEEKVTKKKEKEEKEKDETGW